MQATKIHSRSQLLTHTSRDTSVVCTTQKSVVCTTQKSVVCTTQKSVVCTTQKSVVCTTQKSVVCTTQKSVVRHKEHRPPEPIETFERGEGLTANAMEILDEFVREFMMFLRDEVVHATIDTLRVADYVRSEIAFKTGRAARPAVARVNETIEGNNLARDFVSFFAEGARVFERR